MYNKDWEQDWLKPSLKGPIETVIIEMWKYHMGDPNVEPHHQHQDWYDSLFTDDDGEEYESITPETRFRLKAVLAATPAHIKDKIATIYLNELNQRGRRYVAETNEGNFSGTMEPHITYEVSFSSSLPMDEDYYYDDQIIQDYVEELIRDEDESRGIQAFDFVMGSGWYSGAHIDGTVTWWTGNYSAESLKRWDSDVLILRDYLNTGYIGYLWQFKNRFGTDDPDEIRRLVKEKDDLERVPRWNSMKIGPKTLKKVNNRKTPLPVDFNWDSQFKNAETFEAQEYGNNCYDCGGFLKDCIGYVDGEPCNQAGIGTRLCSKCGDGPRCDSCRKIYDYYGGDNPICEVCYQMVPYNPISNVGESHKRWCKWDAGAGQTAGTCETCWSEPWMWSNDLGYILFDEDSPYYNSDYERMCLHCMEEDFPEIYGHLVNQPVKVEPTSKKRWQFWKSEDFEASSYGSYYGACLLPDGSCTETSLDMCRSLGGRFQGPGTSCYPDAGWARPRVMRAESTSLGLGRGVTIGIVAGIISGLVTTVFGTVISEILLDRLREDPELEITEEDPGTNTPPL